MPDSIVIETDDEFTVVELAEQGPAGPSGSSVPATTTTLGGIIASGHFWITANGTLYLANQTSGGSWGNSTHVSHIEVDGQGRVVTAQSVLIQPDWSSIQNPPNLTIYAPLASPALTGTPMAPTPANGTNTTQLATTAFVANSLSFYATTASLSAYLTTSAASSTYATIASLSSYLTTAAAASTYLTQANAASTYATISSLSSYLTTVSASSTYQTIAGMSSYLTSATASSTYAPLASPALTGNPTAPTQTAGTNNTTLATTAFVTTALGSYATTASLASYATLANNTFTGTQSFNSNILDKPRLQAPRETYTSPTISAGTLTLDLSGSGSFFVSLNAAITTLTISNVPASTMESYFKLELTSDGTARAITWPGSFTWLSGSAPSVPSTNGAKTVIIGYTKDGGTTWTLGSNK